MKRNSSLGRALVLATIVTLAGANLADACSRILWADNGQAVVVARNMDWIEDMRTNLWAFPRGVTHSGLSGDDNSVRWTSKYGSVAASAYDVGTADGINEKGLVVNALWLAASDYGRRDLKVPGLSLSLWTQYMLDNFATVDEAVAATERRDFQVVPASFMVAGAKQVATIHLALADAGGDSAIIEITDGTPHVYHGRAYTVMTNDPPFAEQLENLKRYQGFGGTERLPGTTEAADRFVRAAYYRQHLPKPSNYRETIAGVLSVARNVTQPFGSSDTENPTKHPDLSHTIWRTAADATDRIYYFESTLSPNIVWVRLDALDLAAGAPVRKLDLVHSGDLVGDVTAQFKPAAPLTFIKGGS